MWTQLECHVSRFQSLPAGGHTKAGQAKQLLLFIRANVHSKYTVQALWNNWAFRCIQTAELFFITRPWVPGQYGKLTLLFRNPYLYPINQITVTFKSSSCTLLSASNQQAYWAADAQLLEAICFLNFFFSLSCKYHVRPLPVTSESLESDVNIWTSGTHPCLLCTYAMDVFQNAALRGSRMAKQWVVESHMLI